MDFAERFANVIAKSSQIPPLIRKSHFPYQSDSGDFEISFADNVSVLYVYVN
jgi:hypothetical protein